MENQINESKVISQSELIYTIAKQNVDIEKYLIEKQKLIDYVKDIRNKINEINVLLNNIDDNTFEDLNNLPF